jgi:hypothetical protein
MYVLTIGYVRPARLRQLLQTVGGIEPQTIQPFLNILERRLDIHVPSDDGPVPEEIVTEVERLFSDIDPSQYQAIMIKWGGETPV